MPALPSYRLYLMDPFSGHIDAHEDFHSGDDVEAIHLVQSRPPRRGPMELWRGARKLIRIDGRPETGADVRALRFPATPAGADDGHRLRLAAAEPGE
jgi:hypothetical protein